MLRDFTKMILHYRLLSKHTEKDPTGRFVRSSEIIGKGGSKIVYKALDKLNHTEVAWSEIVLKPQELDSVYSEINLLRSVRHGNIVKLLHYWFDQKRTILVMITELFASGSLRSYFISNHKIVPVEAVKDLARQILKGLMYLHSRHIVHRDLKCDNLFINYGNGELKIGDFGTAIQMHENQNSIPNFLRGTPEFIAPEIYCEGGEFNELVDIYAFGMCVLELVTCDYPYRECKNFKQLRKKVSCGLKPDSLAKVKDPQLKEFIEKCLRPASERLSAAELLQDPFLATSAFASDCSCSNGIGESLEMTANTIPVF